MDRVRQIFDHETVKVCFASAVGLLTWPSLDVVLKTAISILTLWYLVLKIKNVNKDRDL